MPKFVPHISDKSHVDPIVDVDFIGLLLFPKEAFIMYSYRSSWPGKLCIQILTRETVKSLFCFILFFFIFKEKTTTLQYLDTCIIETSKQQALAYFFYFSLDNMQHYLILCNQIKILKIPDQVVPYLILYI